MKYFIYCRKSQEAEDRQVMSLESQIDEVNRLVASDPSIQVVETFVEAFSAKAPGRVEFNRMIARIQAGDAEGIIAWHPDRLARNSIDGGQVIYLLDQGQLKDLRFCNYAFENGSQGKFMLNIIFGYSKYYSDNLSENVKRGMRTKLKNGWRPGAAPVGYLNCREARAITRDDAEAAAIRQLFEWCLEGERNVCELHRRLRDDLCFRTRIKKTSGGKPLSRTQVYRTLTNPFYAGWIVWNGEMHPGKHEPLVTQQEFDRVQELLTKKVATRKGTHDHLYRGLFQCGDCGKAITAEKKCKPSGRTYTYYHCTRVHSNCSQPSIEEKDLDRQVRDFLTKLTNCLPAINGVTSALITPEIALSAETNRKRLEAKQTSVRRQLDNLTELRLRDCVSDDEFNAKRAELQVIAASIAEKLRTATKPVKMFEPIEVLKILLSRATFFFDRASRAQKRRLLEFLSSNRTIIDKKALLYPAFP